MKNRMSITPWPALPDQQPPVAGTAQSMSTIRVGKGVDSVGLCEAWRAWEAGTSSAFLNRLLFTRHGTSSGAEPELLEDWICFRADSSELNHRARTILGDRLRLFRANPAIRIVIGGLAGRQGTIAHGMKLGLRRVMSIRTFLLTAGIHPDRIGIAVRGSGWSVAERSGGPDDPTSQGSEFRLQITDTLWTLARS